MKTKNIIILLFLFITATVSFYFAKTSNVTDTKNIFYNIFSSATVVFLIELIVFIRDWIKYSFLSGIYKRLKIFNENSKKEIDSKYDDMTPIYVEHNVDTNITLHYIGDGKYNGYAYYDKGDKGKTKIILNLDMANPMTGTGAYQYLDKENIDIGVLSFQVDISKKRLYVFHSNLLPSGLAKGYEIWER